MAKTISAIVATIASHEIMPFGNQGLINRVYSTNAFQFHQTDTSLFHSPNLSATADKNADAMASLRKSLTVFLFINYLFKSTIM
jgi:hypothetical protein